MDLSVDPTQPGDQKGKQKSDMMLLLLCPHHTITFSNQYPWEVFVDRLNGHTEVIE